MREAIASETPCAQCDSFDGNMTVEDWCRMDGVNCMDFCDYWECYYLDVLCYDCYHRMRDEFESQQEDRASFQGGYMGEDDPEGTFLESKKVSKKDLKEEFEMVDNDYAVIDGAISDCKEDIGNPVEEDYWSYIDEAISEYIYECLDLGDIEEEETSALRNALENYARQKISGKLPESKAKKTSKKAMKEAMVVNPSAYLEPYRKKSFQEEEIDMSNLTPEESQSLLKFIVDTQASQNPEGFKEVLSQWALSKKQESRKARRTGKTFSFR